jgi:hypothetical protein
VASTATSTCSAGKMADKRFMATSQGADYACLSRLAKSPKTNKPP